MTLEEHERLLRDVLSPLELAVERLSAQCESELEEKQKLSDEVARLTGLVDDMQAEASDSLRPLPTVSLGTASSHPMPSTPSDTDDLTQAVIHRLASMGLLNPRSEEDRRALPGWSPGIMKLRMIVPDSVRPKSRGPQKKLLRPVAPLATSLPL